jgi:hypothetical protein
MRTIITFMLIAICCSTRAQLAILFNPEINGRTTDGMLTLTITNALSQQFEALMTLEVTENATGRVLSVQTQPFHINQGTTQLPRQVLTSAALSFSDNKISRILRQGGQLPFGDYEYCYTITDNTNHSGDVIAEQCFNANVQPFSPLLLISPAEKEELCEKRPLLNWQPLLPAMPGMLYQLSLVELKANQQPVEALQYNIPLINKFGISAPLLVYPASAKALEEGKSYAWQVSAYNGDIILEKSEIWDFTIKCRDSVVVKEPVAFRNIEDLLKGNYYISDGTISFAIENPYESAELNYSIITLKGNSEEIKNLPKILFRRGDNNITIDVSDNKKMVPGDSYYLVVKLPNGIEHKLRFLYQPAL